MNRLKTLLLTFIVSLSACDKKYVFDQYKTFPNQWNKDSVAVFEVQPPDSIAKYNMFIHIRNTDSYAFSNIFLIADMRFPNGKVIKDTLAYEMAYPDGRWMGTGLGEIKASKLWYKENVSFDEKGVYRFQIRQAMRKNGEREGIKNLRGITEVGLRIEKSN